MPYLLSSFTKVKKDKGCQSSVSILSIDGCLCSRQKSCNLLHKERYSALQIGKSQNILWAIAGNLYKKCRPSFVVCHCVLIFCQPYIHFKLQILQMFLVINIVSIYHFNVVSDVQLANIITQIRHQTTTYLHYTTLCLEFSL